MKRRKAETPPSDAERLRALVQPHGQAVVAELARLATGGAKSESVRLAAIKELLDRGYGRPPLSPAEAAAGIIGHVLVDDGYGAEA